MSQWCQTSAVRASRRWATRTAQVGTPAVGFEPELALEWHPIEGSLSELAPMGCPDTGPDGDPGEPLTVSREAPQGTGVESSRRNRSHHEGVRPARWRMAWAKSLAAAPASVVSGLLGQVGEEEVTEPVLGEAQPAALGVEAEQDLGHGQADQLGVGEARRSAGPCRTPSPMKRSSTST